MNKKGLLLALATAFISGISIYLNKFGVSISEPVVFVFIKNSIVALMLCTAFLAWKNRIMIKKINLKKWAVLLVIGVIGGGIPFILFFKGLAVTSSAQGAFIHKTMFVYVAILAIIFLKEKINKYFILGAALILTGNLIIIKNLSFSFNGGDFFILLATLFWAIENIISKYAVKTINADIIAWGRMFFGSIFILGYLAINGQAGELTILTSEQIGWALVTSVLLFGYVITWYRSLAYIPISLAVSILILGSPITMVLTVISGQNINFQGATSAVLAFLGTAIIIIFGYGKIKDEKTEFSGT